MSQAHVRAFGREAMAKADPVLLEPIMKVEVTMPEEYLGDVIGSLNAKRGHDRVRKMVDLLPEDQREVIILRHYADLSFKEIAELTQCSINTALGRMRYGLINLRKMMTEKQIAL